MIADTPGHIQYTRNMVTGASTANLALLLVDARKGVLEQTRRHALLSSLLRVPHLVLCVNKMDLVDYDEAIYEEIREEFTAFAAKLEITDLDFVPISALAGDNVVERSTNMPWFDGQPLLGQLEDVHIASDRNLVDNRFPVQYVIRPQSAEHRDYRGFAGSVVGGIFKQGDEVMVLPSRKTSTIAEIDTPNGAVDQAFPPMAVTMLLEDELDISRGDMICRPTNQPTARQPLRGDDLLVRRDLARCAPGRRTSSSTRPAGSPPRSRTLRYELNVDTLHRDLERGDARGQRHRPGLDPHHLAALLRRVPAQPDHRQLHPRRPRDQPHRRRRDDHRRRRRVGRPATRLGRRRQHHLPPQQPLAARNAARRWAPSGATIWMTGLSGSGKSTIAAAVEHTLVGSGRNAYMLDGDNLRHGLNADLGFSEEDRAENVRRVGEVAKLLAESGVVAIVSLVSPFKDARDKVRAAHEEAGIPFYEVFVDTPLEECERRDPKGLYAKARAGEITDLTGVGSPYEAPERPELTTDSGPGDGRPPGPRRCCARGVERGIKDRRWPGCGRPVRDRPGRLIAVLAGCDRA